MIRALAPALAGFLIGITSAAANEADAAVVRDYCRAEIAATGQVCDCLLRQFDKLTDGQQALVAAIVRDDAAALAAARAELAGAELAQAETFLKAETLLCRPSG
ncbi:MAG TPA: hypothetical protein VFK86_06215 [Bauldia sp.]|nr:hypothetical protein [Bauldia sp.]